MWCLGQRLFGSQVFMVVVVTGLPHTIRRPRASVWTWIYTSSEVEHVRTTVTCSHFRFEQRGQWSCLKSYMKYNVTNRWSAPKSSWVVFVGSCFGDHGVKMSSAKNGPSDHFCGVLFHCECGEMSQLEWRVFQTMMKPKLRLKYGESWKLLEMTVWICKTWNRAQVWRALNRYWRTLLEFLRTCELTAGHQWTTLGR